MRVLVLNGPNLGRLGRRRAGDLRHHHATPSWSSCACDWGRELGLEVEVRQTNHEGELLDWLNEAADDGHAGGAQRRPPGRTTPTRCCDACAQLTAPLVEVHITDPHSGREEFRHTRWSRRTPQA